MSASSEPVVGKRYELVRVVPGDEVACVRFERFRDGSGLAIADSVYVRMKGLDAGRYTGGKVINSDAAETGWRALWDELRGEGFVDADAARVAGLLPADWRPPEIAAGLRW